MSTIFLSHLDRMVRPLQLRLHVLTQVRIQTAAKLVQFMNILSQLASASGGCTMGHSKSRNGKWGNEEIKKCRRQHHCTTTLMSCKTRQQSVHVVQILKYLLHSKNTSDLILGCLSWISVTKECYQIGFLESSSRSFFSSVSQPHRSEDLFGYIPGITTTTMQPRNYPGAAV